MVLINYVPCYSSLLQFFFIGEDEYLSVMNANKHKKIAISHRLLWRIWSKFIDFVVSKIQCTMHAYDFISNNVLCFIAECFLLIKSSHIKYTDVYYTMCIYSDLHKTIYSMSKTVVIGKKSVQYISLKLNIPLSLLLF